uniref:Uncharacterized protein n=1 Tax=Populus trichocarpa TaxID=3694 RepID=A0A3N7FR13_POPTR
MIKTNGQSPSNNKSHLLLSCKTISPTKTTKLPT